MNLKTISFATSIFLAGVGCSTLPRPTVYTSNALDSSLVRPAPTGILLAKR